METIIRKNIRLFLCLLLAIMLLGIFIATNLKNFVSTSQAEIIEINKVVEISKSEDLIRIPENTNADFRLTNDIDLCADISWMNIVEDSNKGWKPIVAPLNTGKLDGCGYKITGLHIERADESNVGLFATTKLMIENLNIEICAQEGEASIKGGNIVGALVAVAQSPIVNCIAIGNLESGNIIGGLVGTTSSEIRNCEFRGKVLGQIAGGLVGEIDSTTVSNSLAEADISGVVAGGLVGIIDCTNGKSTVSNCLSYTELQNGTEDSAFCRIGSFVGVAENTTDFVNCYSLNTFPAVAQGANGKITVIDRLMFLDKNNFDLDFDNIWYFSKNSICPNIRHLIVEIKTPNIDSKLERSLLGVYFYEGENVELDLSLKSYKIKRINLNGKDLTSGLNEGKLTFKAYEHNIVTLEVDLLLHIILVSNEGGKIMANKEFISQDETLIINVEADDGMRLSTLSAKYHDKEVPLLQNDCTYLFTTEDEIKENDEMVVFACFEKEHQSTTTPTSKIVLWTIIGATVAISIIALMVVMIKKRNKQI